MNDVVHINLSRPEPYIAASELDAVIQAYLDYCRAIVASDTIDNYALKIEYFRQWWRDVGPSKRHNLAKSCLQEFSVYLSGLDKQRGDGKLAFNTRKDVHRRLRQCLRWAYNEGIIERDCSDWVPPAPGTPPKRQPLTQQTLRLLMRAAENSPVPQRNVAILAFLIGTGIRRAECASINIHQVVFHVDDSGTAVVRGKRTKSNVDGVRTVAFDRHAGHLIKPHHEEMDNAFNSIGALFRSSRSGKRLSEQGIYKVVKWCVEEAGLEDVIGRPCHDLRRAFTTFFLNKRRGEVHGDILRRQLGHASFSMTAEYSDMTAEDFRSSIVSPLSEL